MKNLFMFDLDMKNNVSKLLSITLMNAKNYIYFTHWNQRLLNLDVFKKKDTERNFPLK